MAINYTALKNELLTDPTNLGYAPLIASGSDNQLADLMNQVIVGNSVNTKRVTNYQLFTAIVYADYVALTAVQRNYVDNLLRFNTVDLNDQEVKNGINNVFGTVAQAKPTRLNIQAAASRDGSRAETLFGADTYITDQDIAKALRETQALRV